MKLNEISAFKNVFVFFFQIDGLAGLILCSGVVVAAGSEPFRLGNYSSQGAGQMAQIMYMDPVEPSVLQPGTGEL